jgi:hypothetical protein
MRHPCSKPSCPQKTFEIQTQIYKAIEKMAKPSTNTKHEHRQNRSPKRPDEKRVSIIDPDPLKSAPSNLHLPNCNKSDNPQTKTPQKRNRP